MSDLIMPNQLVLTDETGQAWAISVRPDGQLQTVKWPDSEPRVPEQMGNEKLAEIVRFEMRQLLRSYPE